MYTRIFNFILICFNIDYLVWVSDLFHLYSKAGSDIQKLFYEWHPRKMNLFYLNFIIKNFSAIVLIYYQH